MLACSGGVGIAGSCTAGTAPVHNKPLPYGDEAAVARDVGCVSAQRAFMDQLDTSAFGAEQFFERNIIAHGAEASKPFTTILLKHQPAVNQRVDRAIDGRSARSRAQLAKPCNDLIGGGRRCRLLWHGRLLTRQL